MDNILLVNLYLHSKSPKNARLYQEIISNNFAESKSSIDSLHFTQIIIGGYFNLNNRYLSAKKALHALYIELINYSNLKLALPINNKINYTYFNLSNNHILWIDFFLHSSNINNLIYKHLTIYL